MIGYVLIFAASAGVISIQPADPPFSASSGLEEVWEHVATSSEAPGMLTGVEPYPASPMATATTVGTSPDKADASPDQAEEPAEQSDGLVELGPQLKPITTLGEAIALAYRTNPDLLAARARTQSADFQVPKARAAYGPVLSASGTYTFTHRRVETIPGTFEGTRGWASSASLVLTQPIWTFGRNAAGVAGAVATAQYQREALRVTEAQVLSNVVTAYVSVLRDVTAVSIARENLALLERQLVEVRARYAVLDVTLTDLDQTETRVELGRAQLIRAQGQLGVSQKTFLQYVGAPPGQLAPPDLLAINFTSLKGAYSYAETNSPVILAAMARERISRAALKGAEAEWGPRIDASGSYTYGTVTPYSDRARATELVGQVSVTQTLFDSGLRSASVGEAREANQADWRLLDAAFRQTRETIGSAWDQLASTRTSLESYRLAVEAARRAYLGALIQQKAGDRSTLDVLDLARDLLTVRNNYNLAIADEYLARASLLAAAGLLEGPDLLPSIEAYDPENHFERVKNNGDIPLFTPLMSAVDGLTVGHLRKDRKSRDEGAQQALKESMPLPPPVPLRDPLGK